MTALRDPQGLVVIDEVYSWSRSTLGLNKDLLLRQHGARVGIAAVSFVALLSAA